MSDATPAACATHDGPLYEAICQRANPGDYGICTLQETGKACGQAPSEPAICDGSSEIRLGFEVQGERISPSDYFAYPYGYYFGVVDGKCRYYASINYMEGIFTGQLSPDEAVQLAEQLQYGRIKEWTGHYGTSCFGQGPTILASPDGAVHCTCGCDGAPAGVSTALERPSAHLRRWVQQGKALDQGVSALACAAPGCNGDGAVQDWPLMRSITSIPGLVSAGENASDPGAAFAAGPDATTLRELRQHVYTTVKYPGFVRVQESGSANIYALYVRDDLPPDVAMRVQTFFQTAEQR
jgi:hypothetical protein